MSFPGLPAGESPEERRRRLAKAKADAAARNKGKATAGALVDVKGNGNDFLKAISNLAPKAPGGGPVPSIFSNPSDAGFKLPQAPNPFKAIGDTVGGWFKSYGGALNDVFTNKSQQVSRGAHGGGSSVKDNYAYSQRNAGSGGGAAGGDESSITDLIAQLSQAFGAGQGGGTDIGEYQNISYDPARNEAKSASAAAAQALAGIYQQLNSEFAETGAATDKRYADAQAQIGQNRDQAVQSTQGAYAASQGQQQQMLNTLGIQNEAARAVEEGRDLAGRGAGAVAGLNSGALANQNYLASSGVGENRFNGRLQEAGQAAGARAQSGVQSSLASKLAEIAMAENQANQQGRAAHDSAAAQAAAAGQSGAMGMNDIVGLAQWMIENQQSQERNVVTDAQNSLKGSGGANNLAALQQIIKQNPGIDPDLLKIYASVL
jgi:hypothetical protein